MENSIVILGCGGHARSVATVILDNNPLTELLFVDENAHAGETIFGFPVVKSLPADAKNIFVAIGNNQRRQQLSEGKKLISVISSRANISSGAIIEEGCFVAAGAYVGPLARIGRGTIVNTHSVVEHEVKVGEFCHIAPHTTICGRSTLKNNVFLGAGSTVIDKINICSDVIIGAGGVVIQNLDETGIYVGCPVKKIK